MEGFVTQYDITDSSVIPDMYQKGGDWIVGSELQCNGELRVLFENNHTHFKVIIHTPSPSFFLPPPPPHIKGWGYIGVTVEVRYSVCQFVSFLSIVFRKFIQNFIKVFISKFWLSYFG